jgi:type III pantothenate kinase
MCEQYFGIEAYFVQPALNSPIPLAVDTPAEVGADRIVDAFAATVLYGAPLIVVDFGTATTFDCVNERGEFIGGAIAPGIVTSVEALVSRAARLYRVELLRPKEAIGRNTVTNLQSGVVYGFAGLVDGVIARMKTEMGGNPTVVGTGGLVSLIAEVASSIQHVNDDLRLEGLRLIWDGARGGRSDPPRHP